MQTVDKCADLHLSSRELTWPHWYTHPLFSSDTQGRSPLGTNRSTPIPTQLHSPRHMHTVCHKDKPHAPSTKTELPARPHEDPLLPDAHDTIPRQPRARRGVATTHTHKKACSPNRDPNGYLPTASQGHLRPPVSQSRPHVRGAGRVLRDRRQISKASE